MAKQSTNSKKLHKRIEEFNNWFSALTELDRMNFKTLISLPDAEELLGKMPEGKYKEMAVFALVIKTALKF